jgi:hypothetical protein
MALALLYALPLVLVVVAVWVGLMALFKIGDWLFR